MSKEIIGTVIIIICIIILLGFVLFIVNIISLHQKSREKFLLDLEQMKNNFRNEILQSELEMQEQTFEDISMEIHDNISQILLVSKLNLTMIEAAAPEVNEKIQYAVELLSRAMKDLRHLSRRLDSDIIRQEGLYKAIGEYIDQLRKSVTKEIIFNAQGIPDHLTLEKELILFRILQEAINNILKHADASRIVVDLSFSREQLQLEITDNGKGFNLAELLGQPGTGAGLKNMQKRIRMISGQFSMETEPGKGTRIDIRLPANPEEPNAITDSAGS
jgi:two-component system, NarL family, sensor kinase